MTALSFAHPDVRQAAAEALGRISDPRAAQSLMPLLNDADKWVRESASEALRKMGYQESSSPNSGPSQANAGARQAA